MEKVDYGAGIFTIKNFLSKEECLEFIAQSEQVGYEDAPIQTDGGPQIIENVRNNDRIVFDDVQLSERLFLRAKPHLPDTSGNEWQLTGFNERFRFYKYSSGQYFKWHKDGFYCRTKDEISQLSFLIYLNDDYIGGFTDFNWDKVKPETGMALVFPHLLRHQGNQIDSGIKYMLRTDVMYKRISSTV